MQDAARWLYALAVGLFVVMTVGFGVVTFFPDPKAPQQFIPKPAVPASAPGAAPAPALPPPADEQEAFQRTYEQYQQDRSEHRRVALAIITIIAVGFVVGGVLATRALDVLGIGLMLGGLFTMLWGLVYAAADAGSGTMFGAALVALLVMIGLGVPAIRQRLQHALFPRGDGDVLGPGL